jgi:hypothetical protein
VTINVNRVHPGGGIAHSRMEVNCRV